MPLALSLGDAFIGVVLVVLATLQFSYATGLRAFPGGLSVLGRRQAAATGCAFLFLGVGRLAESDLVGGVGLLFLIAALVLGLRRRRRGESVFSLRRP